MKNDIIIWWSTLYLTLQHPKCPFLVTNSLNNSQKENIQNVIKLDICFETIIAHINSDHGNKLTISNYSIMFLNVVALQQVTNKVQKDIHLQNIIKTQISNLAYTTCPRNYHQSQNSNAYFKIRRVWRYQRGNQNRTSRTDNTMVKGKSIKGQTTIYKTYT